MTFTPPQGRAVLADADPTAAGLRLTAERPTSWRARLLDTFPRDLWRRGELVLAGRDSAWWLGPGRAVAAPALEAPTRALPDALADLRALLGLRALLPVAELTVHQRVWVARDEVDKIVARVVEHTWTSQARSARTLCVTPLRGYDAEAAAITLTGEVSDHPALDALAAVLGPPPAWSNKPPLGLGPDTTTFDAARYALRTLVALARQTEPGLRADHDTEFLHDYRVLLRAARSVLSVFKGALDPDATAALKAGLKQLAGRTNTLRDLDVHLLAADALRARVLEVLQDGLRPFDEGLAARRQKAFRAVRRHLGSPAYEAEVAAVQAALDAATPGPKGDVPLGRLARRRLRAAVDAVRARGRALTDDTPAELVHELRIEAKKLRYTLELLRDLYAPAPARDLVKRLKQLQDVLGAFNDAAVQAHGLLHDARRARDAQPETLLAVGALIGALHSEQRQARAGVAAAFARFDAPDLDTLVDALTPEPT